jgi:hypothetical protein
VDNPLPLPALRGKNPRNPQTPMPDFLKFPLNNRISFHFFTKPLTFFLKPGILKIADTVD